MTQALNLAVFLHEGGYHSWLKRAVQDWYMYSSIVWRQTEQKAISICQCIGYTLGFSVWTVNLSAIFYVPHGKKTSHVAISMLTSKSLQFFLKFAELLVNHDCSPNIYWWKARDNGNWVLCGGCAWGEHRGWDTLLRPSIDQVQSQIFGWCLREDGCAGPNWTHHQLLVHLGMGQMC